MEKYTISMFLNIQTHLSSGSRTGFIIVEITPKVCLYNSLVDIDFDKSCNKLMFNGEYENVTRHIVKSFDSLEELLKYASDYIYMNYLEFIRITLSRLDEESIAKVRRYFSDNDRIDVIKDIDSEDNIPVI